MISVGWIRRQKLTRRQLSRRGVGALSKSVTGQNTKRARKTFDRHLTRLCLVELTVALVKRRGIEAQSEFGRALHGDFAESRVPASRSGSEHPQSPQSGRVPDEDRVKLPVSDRRGRSNRESTAELRAVRDHNQQIQKTLTCHRRRLNAHLHAAKSENLVEGAIDVDEFVPQPARTRYSLQHRYVESESAGVEKEIVFDAADVHSRIRRHHRPSRHFVNVGAGEAEVPREVVSGAGGDQTEPSVGARLKNGSRHVSACSIAANADNRGEPGGDGIEGQPSLVTRFARRQNVGYALRRKSITDRRQQLRATPPARSRVDDDGDALGQCGDPLATMSPPDCFQSIGGTDATCAKTPRARTGHTPA